MHWPPTFTRNFCVSLLWVVALEGGGGLWRGRIGTLAQVGCVWEVDGGTIDLRSLSNSDGTPRFNDVKGEVGTSPWYYSYNPCTSFTESLCVNVAVCQRDQSRSMYYDCGQTNTASMGTDKGYPALVYTSDKGLIPRKSTIALICDKKATTPSLRALGDLKNGDYHFELTSVCACPGGCSGTSLSAGTILLIVVLALAFVYVVGGIVFNLVRKKSGTELIPNVGFWKSFPGFVKAGRIPLYIRTLQRLIELPEDVKIGLRN